MRRLFLGLLIFSVFLATPTKAESPSQRFSTCEKLRSSFKFSSGVARDSKSVGMTGAGVDRQLYEANKHLDKDSDGVACEYFVYDSGITIRSPGFTSMYSACKIERQTEFESGNILFSDYPYHNERMQLLIGMMGATQQLPLVRSAAKINPIFASALKAAEHQLKIWTILWQSWPKEPWTPAPDFNLNHWCVYFGVYDSTPGLLPPISWVEPKRSMTVLNGARGVCKRLFWSSPDGVVYSDEESITLSECDREAVRISRRADSYNEAKTKMIEHIFGFNYGFRETWCWGKDCVTRFDFY